jgi:GMC oxidoreductase
LLLNSACTQFPDGLANRSGLVGRRLMLHPLASVFGLFGEFLHSWQGQAGASIQSMQFYCSDPNRGFIRGARWSLTPTGGPMRNALAGGVWGPEHHARLRERLGHGASWALIAEDLPELDNRVELSTTTTDSSGIPGATVNYRMSDNTRRILEWHGARAAESLREAGAVHTEFNWLPRNGHLLGTARMGDDPATSVVDRWGMAHDIANLGIIDGSVFVTAGGVNPTSTICALALRAAEHLLERRADVPAPDRVRIFAPGPTPLGAQSRADAEPDLEFDERERRRFELWANFLIPGTSQMPSPSEVGVPGPLLDQVLQARPYLAPALRDALQREPQTDDPTLGLNDLRPGQRIALTTAVAGAYYLAPEVRARIGYPGQQTIPVPSFRLPQYFEEGLIDRVLERTELTS